MRATNPESDMAGPGTTLYSPAKNKLQEHRGHHHAPPAEMARPCVQDASQPPATPDLVRPAPSRSSFSKGAEEEVEGPTKDCP